MPRKMIVAAGINFLIIALFVVGLSSTQPGLMLAAMCGMWPAGAIFSWGMLSGGMKLRSPISFVEDRGSQITALPRRPAAARRAAPDEF